MFRLILLIFFLSTEFFLPIFVQAEKLGTIEFEDLVLRPRFEWREPKQTEFRIGESSLAARFRLNPSISSVFRVGPKLLMNPMHYIEVSSQDELTLVEAYGEFEFGGYGRLRAGLIPIQFGKEGSLSEGDLIFPRSYLFEKGLAPLRDGGVSYRTGHRGIFTELSVHNGEGLSNQDQRVWYTGKWGWTNEFDFELAFSGLTGTTKPSATSTSKSQIAGFDASRNSKWRLAGVSARYSGPKYHWLLESYSGELNQEDKLTGLFVGHFDLTWSISKTFGLQTRFDYYDPNLRVDKNIEQAISAGIRFSDRNGRSNLYMIFKKVLEEQGQIPNDEFQLIWSLNPTPWKRPTRQVDL